MATLSRHPILVDFFNPENGEWNSHVSLGTWADLYLIVPATANTIGKMAHGIADNLLLTCYLSARCPVALAPAMDLDMYAHPTTQENIEKLRNLGVRIIEPGSGELASGLTGKGRMAEPEEIIEQVRGLLPLTMSLQGRYLIVTAGPTIEPLDPVRFLSNHSSGKMGYAIAGALAARGAHVALVSGRTCLPTPAGTERIDVLSAEEMYRAVMERFPQADGAVMCAAVADYTPAEVSPTKIKKGDGEMVVRLKRTKDIAAEAGRVKGNRLLVGFALATDNERNNALDKMRRKNFDFIVLNSLRDKGAGFSGDTNKNHRHRQAGTHRRIPAGGKNRRRRTHRRPHRSVVRRRAGKTVIPTSGEGLPCPAFPYPPPNAGLFVPFKKNKIAPERKSVCHYPVFITIFTG